MTSTQINQGNYSAFQTFILLQIPENFDDIAMDDIFYTVYSEGSKMSDFINRIYAEISFILMEPSMKHMQIK